MRGIQIKEYVKVSFISIHEPLLPRGTLNLIIQKSPKELRVTDLPDPVPKKDDEYLIQVHATAANFFDILQIQGKYQTQPRTVLPSHTLLSKLIAQDLSKAY